MNKFPALLIVSCLALLSSGCVATSIEKVRKKIPSGYAGEMSVTITTMGGWGASLSGKNVESNGRGQLIADEYHETVRSPWASYDIVFTDAAIGKKKVVAKPEDEIKKDTEDEK